MNLSCVPIDSSHNAIHALIFAGLQNHFPQEDKHNRDHIIFHHTHQLSYM